MNLQYPTNFSRSGVRFDLIAQKIQSDLGDAGINVTLKPGEINTELANPARSIRSWRTTVQTSRDSVAGDHLGETAHSERVLEYYDIIGRAGTPFKNGGPAYLASVPRQQIPMRHVVNPYSGGPTIPK